MRRFHRCDFLGIAVLTIVLVILATTSVAAHAQLKSSDPADKAILAKAPTQVILTFSEETSPTKSGGSATDASGVMVSTGFKVDLNDRTKMTIDLKPNLPNGGYTVKWNSFTEDDNGMADGAFSFTIQVAAGTATTASGTPPVSSSDAVGTVSPNSPTAAASTATTTSTAASATAAAPTTTRIAATLLATSAPTTLPQTGGGTSNHHSLLLWLIIVVGAVLVSGGIIAVRRTAKSR